MDTTDRIRWKSWTVGGLLLGSALIPLVHHAFAQPNPPLPASAEPPGAAPLTELKTIERVTAAADRGLKYLASKQLPNGSWHNNQAINALAVLAFLGRGNVPGRGPYRDVLEKAQTFLVANTNPQTGYCSFNSMYEHGMATLAMAELYGMDPDPKLEDALRQAVALIIKAQSPNGGWRYQPTPGDHDLSVTVMQIVALRAANNAEIPVPAQVIEKAIGYVRACAHPNGGYGYQPGGLGPHTSGAGVLSLQLLGKYDDKTIPKALDYLATIPVEWSAAGGVSYYYYFHYYAIQAKYQAGGKHWNDWHPKVRELLLSKQNSDGSWDVPPGTAEPGSVDPNKVYFTAMACVILDIYMHFLPAYQR